MIVYVPAGVVELVLMVRTEVAAPAPEVTGWAENAQVAPVGRPEEQDRLTAALNPFDGEMEIVEAAAAPAETVTGDVAEIVKSGVLPAWTVRLTDVVWLTDVEVPVIVTL
jgi:hypothetical protein